MRPRRTADSDSVEYFRSTRGLFDNDGGAVVLRHERGRYVVLPQYRSAHRRLKNLIWFQIRDIPRLNLVQRIRGYHL